MIWEYICRVDCFDVKGVKTWADKFSCPMCGFVHSCVEGHGRYNYCPQCGSKMVHTEQEYLQTCNTEQLAEWICSVREKCYYCGAKRISDRKNCPFGNDKCMNNKHEFVRWLKEKHDEM